MNRLRKAYAWLWANKERMVLAIMLAILGFRAYQMFNPKRDDALQDSFQIPRPQLPEDDPRLPQLPPVMPPSPSSEDWSRLWRSSPFTYRQPRQGGTRGGSADAAEEFNVTLLDIRQKGNKTWMAKIRTDSRADWYDEGESFEQYTLQSVDPDARCVAIFSEQLQKMKEVCIEESSKTP